MINCILKMLGVSLVQGYDTFTVWSILVIPAVAAALLLLVAGLRGVAAYTAVGRTHALAGWTLVGVAAATYLAVALWSAPSRNDFKQFAIANVKDKTAAAETRKMSMLVDTGRTREAIPEKLDLEQSTALLRAIQTYLDDAGDDEQATAFHTVLGDYIKSVPSVNAARQDAVQTTAMLLEAIFQNARVEDLQRLLGEIFRTGDLGGAVKTTFKSWFKELGQDARPSIEEAAYQTGIPNERDSREIAYRSGYGTPALGVIRFFVAAQRWFRGLLWFLAAAGLGFWFVAGGRRIMDRAGEFKRGHERRLDRILSGNR